jgi:hypothetical protein
LARWFGKDWQVLKAGTEARPTVVMTFCQYYDLQSCGDTIKLFFQPDISGNIIMFPGLAREERNPDN